MPDEKNLLTPEEKARIRAEVEYRKQLEDGDTTVNSKPFFFWMMGLAIGLPLVMYVVYSMLN